MVKRSRRGNSKRQIITENKPFAALVVRICFHQFCMSMCRYICANSISLKYLLCRHGSTWSLGLLQGKYYKKINVGFKVVFDLPGSFSKAGMFCVTNSWLPPKEQSPSFIFSLPAFAAISCTWEAIPPRLWSFRCPKQSLVTHPLPFLVYALNLQS